ncbi:MAG: hypothetical protein ACLP8S_19625 [Solirubrobacteraceae bacterium]
MSVTRARWVSVRRRALPSCLAAAAALTALWVIVDARTAAEHPTLTAVTAPMQASSFVQSIGVDLHLAEPNSSYQDFPLILTRLRQLGVQHVRDSLLPTASGRQLTEIDDLGALGIRSTLIAGDPAAGLPSSVLVLADRVARYLDALEGPNEWDLYGGPQWVSALKSYQLKLYEGVKHDPVLHAVPVVAPSLVAGAWRRLGNIQNIVDIGNGHPYAGPNMTPLARLDEQLPDYRLNSGGHPVWVTETGFQTAPGARNFQAGVDASVEPGLILRTYLEYFKRGIARTFVYELADERPDPANVNGQNHYGLLYASLSPKPAFVALQDMIMVLRDPGPAFIPRSYHAQLSGSLTGVQELTLAKRDGLVDIILWRRVDVWDPVALEPIQPAEETVTVRLPRKAPTVQVFVPALRGGPQRTLRDVSALTVRLGAEPTIIAVTR